MSLEDILGYISSKNGTDLDKTWQRGREWGKSDPIKFLARSLQKPQRKGQNTNLFAMNTTQPFGRFRFTDFR